MNDKAELMLIEVKNSGGDVATLRKLMIKHINFGHIAAFDRLVAKDVINLTKGV